MNQPPFSRRLIDIRLPDLGAGTQPVTFLMWLVPRGAAVIPGERIAELLTQGVVWQLGATESGILQEPLARPGQQVAPGDLLGRIVTTADE